MFGLFPDGLTSILLFTFISTPNVMFALTFYYFHLCFSLPPSPPLCLSVCLCLCHCSVSLFQYYNSYGVKANLTIDCVVDAISELQLFRQAGGQTVVDVTPFELRLNTKEVPRIARDSGVNIIIGTGHYFDAFVSDESKELSIQEVHYVLHASLWSCVYYCVCVHIQAVLCQLYPFVCGDEVRKETSENLWSVF